MLRQTVLSHSFKTTSQSLLFIPKRWNNKKYKEMQLEKLSNRVKALTQFDDFYPSLFQDQWPSIRVALLCAEKKGVVINNFSDKERIRKQLQNMGAYNIRKIYEDQSKALKIKIDSSDPSSTSSKNIYQIEGGIGETFIRQQQNDMADIYPEPLDSEVVEKISQNLVAKHGEKVSDESDDESLPDDPTKDQPLSESLKNADYDSSRLIFPGPTGIALSASLYDYVPATKLKGMDDFIPESSHYKYYKDVVEAPIDFELDTELSFPQHLDVYAYERGNCDTFNYSTRGTTEVYDYHILKLGTLAPVLALGLKEGETVLDLTASSLDIPMLICQTLIPGLFVINCGKTRRFGYFLKYFDSFFYETSSDTCNFVLTDDHPLAIEDAGLYDKVIVTVPSTFDREAVNKNEGNMFSPSLIQERLRLPELQTAFLSKAMDLVKEGGTVVYCTETLSPIQNDAVVQRALEKQWTESKTKFTIKDLSRTMEPLQPMLKIVPSGKYGQLVTPFLPNNCGPLYFSKIVKNRNQTGEE
ncbi:5-methylcytosine rRNA methyltransferase NSUN4 [Frankliniella occidentalis]|uniref:NOL1/NOP2/Sun domain family member 4 n=1 Tax=Frankliniella occidentalis TaxID=133901 RepID=A0A6J1S9L1_FRAOC|nr:5-methylcytosine rRNA methyltransferase NSUN4 [Frankliniella occidentalis]